MKENPMQKIMMEVKKEYPPYANFHDLAYYFLCILARYSVYIEQELDKLRPDSTSLNKLYEEIYTLRQAQYQEELLYGSK